MNFKWDRNKLSAYSLQTTLSISLLFNTRVADLDARATRDERGNVPPIGKHAAAVWPLCFGAVYSGGGAVRTFYSVSGDFVLFIMPVV